MGQAGGGQLVTHPGDEVADLPLGRVVEGDGRDAVGVVEQDAVAPDLVVVRLDAQEVGVEPDGRDPQVGVGFEAGGLVGGEEQKARGGERVAGVVGPERPAAGPDPVGGEVVGPVRAGESTGVRVGDLQRETAVPPVI